MSKGVLQGFSAVPDVGNLKLNKDEYAGLINIRGFGRLGAKRTGIRTLASYDSGVMGIFDLRNDGDPGSADKILVVLQNGDLVTYSQSDFDPQFYWGFELGSGITMQSSDGRWWDLKADPDLDKLYLNEVAAPAYQRNSNFTFSSGQWVGFSGTLGIERLWVEDKKFKVQRYGFGEPKFLFQYNVGFRYPWGPVFTQDSGTRWRVGVSIVNHNGRAYIRQL
jgi:hypothetical protein